MTVRPEPLPLVTVDRPYWRVLSPRWASAPLSGAGAARRGGRWNEPGQPALYLSEDHITAFAEYMQDLERPGLFTPYHVRAERIADLCDSKTLAVLDVETTTLFCPWARIARIEQRRPPSWALAARLVAADADGARVPSAQRPGGVNLVLWRWNGEGTAHVGVRDPLADLPRDGSSWAHRG